MGERKYCNCGWDDKKNEKKPNPNCPVCKDS